MKSLKEYGFFCLLLILRKKQFDETAEIQRLIDNGDKQAKKTKKTKILCQMGGQLGTDSKYFVFLFFWETL